MKKLFEIDPANNVPIWVQLRQRLIYLIKAGHFKPGDQLPTVRGLAADISINYNTVNKAYLSLIHDGYITSSRGRGVFVCELNDAENGEAGKEAEALLSEWLQNARDLGLSNQDIHQLLTRQLSELRVED